VALEPLFGSRAGDDPVALAPTERGAEPAVLVPERLEALVEVLDLGPEGQVVNLREATPLLDPELAQLIDLARTNLFR